MTCWFIRLLSICFYVDNFSALLTHYIFLNLNVCCFGFVLRFFFPVRKAHEKLSCLRLFIRIVNQGKNKFEIFKMPLSREEMFYKNELQNLYLFIFKDVFVMYFTVRISSIDKLTWIVLSNFALCYMCFMHIFAVGFSPTESGFTTGTLTSTNRFLFQLQALWLCNITSIFLLSLKIIAFSYYL